ncbi:MAG: DUF434 domain-containing protein [Isosphaeraceae bacterium]
MSDRRTHRGADPRDAEAFAPDVRPALRGAVDELSWLLERGYTPVASLKLVGDHWSLTERQRMAVLRSSCGDSALSRRQAHRVEPASVAQSGGTLQIDAFNVLTTVEAALGGAVVLVGRDGCLRDIAGVHGTYRKVEETLPALRLVGETLERLGVACCTWLLDRPVSNSGRLRAAMEVVAAERGWVWQIELVDNPDPILAASPEVVATADSVILDRCERWLNLSRTVVETAVPNANVVDLSAAP